MRGAHLILVAVLALCGACTRNASDSETATWKAELDRLQTEQDSLRNVVDSLMAADPRVRSLPQGEVVIAVPTAFLRSIVERVFSDVAEHVTLRLSGIKAHVEESVKKIVTLGDLVLDVTIDEVVGKLKPGVPNVYFGGNKISMTLPVELTEGRGDATIHCVWNGKNIADVVCGDLDITQKVTGTVIPASYKVSGALDLQSRRGQVVGVPVFPVTKLRLRVKPSQESWDAIQKILDEKHGVCGFVLDKVNVPKLLTGLIEEKGINVRLPLQKLKPFELPGGLRDSVRVGDDVLAIDAKTNMIRIDPDAIWYSADVGIAAVDSAAAAAAAAAAPPAAVAAPPATKP